MALMQTHGNTDMATALKVPHQRAPIMPNLSQSHTCEQVNLAWCVFCLPAIVILVPRWFSAGSPVIRRCFSTICPRKRAPQVRERPSRPPENRRTKTTMRLSEDVVGIRRATARVPAGTRMESQENGEGRFHEAAMRFRLRVGTLHKDSLSDCPKSRML